MSRFSRSPALAPLSVNAAKQGVGPFGAWSVLSALILGLVFVRHGTSAANTDVAWLLTVGEHWLGGARLYRDIVETNPPASILIYEPAILLARLMGTSSELTTTVLVVAGALAATWLTLAVLVRAGLVEAERAERLGCGMLAVLLLVPANSFAEREHVAALSALPLLAAFAVRLRGGQPDAPTRLLAGAGAAVTVAIKPMFVLAFVGPAWLLLRRHGWRALLRDQELVLAAGLAGLYGVAVLVLFPGFVRDVLPEVLLAYVPVRASLGALLTSATALVLLALLIQAMLLRARGSRDPWGAVLVVAAAGFYAAFLVQGKAWPYQIMPAVLLAQLAVLSRLNALQPGAPGPALRAAVTAAFVAASLLAFGLFDNHLDPDTAFPGLSAAVARTAPHPRVMAITSEIAVGHPLVRSLGGRWVGTYAFQWITAGLDAQKNRTLPPGIRAALDRFAADERATVAADLTRRKPDALIVQGPRWIDYLNGDPAMKAAFAGYRKAGDFGLVSLWVPKGF